MFQVEHRTRLRIPKVVRKVDRSLAYVTRPHDWRIRSAEKTINVRTLSACMCDVTQKNLSTNVQELVERGDMSRNTVASNGFDVSALNKHYFSHYFPQKRV